MTPISGHTIWWRMKGDKGTYQFGYVTYLNYGLIRLGTYNGDVNFGPVVDPSDIEWREYA